MVGMAGLNYLPCANRSARRYPWSCKWPALTDAGGFKVVSIQEITGMEGEIITMQEVYSFHQTGVDPVDGVFRHSTASGVRPR